MLLARASRPDVTFAQHPGIQHGDLKGATTEEGSNVQSKLPNAIAGIYSSAKKSDFCSKTRLKSEDDLCNLCNLCTYCTALRVP